MGPRDQKQGQLGAGEGGKVGGKVPALQRKRRNPLKVSGGRGRFIMVTLKPVGQPSEFQDTRGQEIETETKTEIEIERDLVSKTKMQNNLTSAFQASGKVSLSRRAAEAQNG